MRNLAKKDIAMASIFFRTVIIYLTLSFSMRIMGKREIGELEVSELVTSLLLSEICSIPIDNPDIPLLNAIIPVLFIVSLEIIVSAIKNKSNFMKKTVDGRCAYIIYKGRFIEKTLRANRISIEEFFTAMRQNGVGNIEDIEYCILEPNGKISIIERSNNQNYSHLLISDGEINDGSLSTLGYDRRWLKSKLGKRQPEEIFVFCYNDDGTSSIVLKENAKK